MATKFFDKKSFIKEKSTPSSSSNIGRLFRAAAESLPYLMMPVATEPFGMTKPEFFKIREKLPSTSKEKSFLHSLPEKFFEPIKVVRQGEAPNIHMGGKKVEGSRPLLDYGAGGYAKNMTGVGKQSKLSGHFPELNSSMHDITITTPNAAALDELISYLPQLRPYTIHGAGSNLARKINLVSTFGNTGRNPSIPFKFRAALKSISPSAKELSFKNYSEIMNNNINSIFESKGIPPSQRFPSYSQLAKESPFFSMGEGGGSSHLYAPAETGLSKGAGVELFKIPGEGSSYLQGGISASKNRTFIDDVFVAPSLRGRGIASKLTQDTLSLFPKNDVFTASSSEGMQKIAGRLGFEQLTKGKGKGKGEIEIPKEVNFSNADVFRFKRR